LFVHDVSIAANRRPDIRSARRKLGGKLRMGGPAAPNAG
jgi:hypothetical protein